MSDIKELFLKGWLVKFTYSKSQNYKKVISYITNLSNIEETWKIYYNPNYSSFKEPYFSNEKLEFHNDWLWEDNINPLYIFLKCNIKADTWWENFFVDSKAVLAELPEYYLNLKYEFSLFNDNVTVQDLFIKHPLDWYPCLNFTSYGMNKDWKSIIIKFINKTEEENKKLLSFLCKVINKNVFFVDIYENQIVIFDNYRYLHWRNSFTWYRELERILVYL